MNENTSVTTDLATTEVAILLDDSVNKYHPGLQVFRLQSVNGLQNNSTTITTVPIMTQNLMNKDPNSVGWSEAKTMAVVKLELPRDVTRNYPTKFIPAGTRFIVSFTSGDMTKPIIIGREFS